MKIDLVSRGIYKIIYTNDFSEPIYSLMPTINAVWKCDLRSYN